MNGPLPINSSLSREEVKALDAYRDDNGRGSRSEAARHLILSRLYAEGYLDDLGQSTAPPPTA